jgi:hypothetical protein
MLDRLAVPALIFVGGELAFLGAAGEVEHLPC